MLSLAPYFVLALLDGWMHKTSRRISIHELLAHIGIFIFVGLFIVFALSNRVVLSLVVLPIGVLFLAIDEFRFHGGISVIEKRVHFAADLSLMGFVMVWAVTAFLR